MRRGPWPTGRVVVVVAAVFSLPLLVVGGFFVGAALGCTAETYGGLAGEENDPCRDAAPAMLLGVVAGGAVWLGLVLLTIWWADRAGAGGDDDPEGQAALVSPAASPKTSG
ncbi:MAG TPA: hypothetical protein VF228_03690 [Iamia sp.]